MFLKLKRHDDQAQKRRAPSAEKCERQEAKKLSFRCDLRSYRKGLALNWWVGLGVTLGAWIWMYAYAQWHMSSSQGLEFPDWLSLGGLVIAGLVLGYLLFWGIARVQDIIYQHQGELLVDEEQIVCKRAFRTLHFSWSELIEVVEYTDSKSPSPIHYLLLVFPRGWVYVPSTIPHFDEIKALVARKASHRKAIGEILKKAEEAFQQRQRLRNLSRFVGPLLGGLVGMSLVVWQFNQVDYSANGLPPPPGTVANALALFIGLMIFVGYTLPGAYFAENFPGHLPWFGSMYRNIEVQPAIYPLADTLLSCLRRRSRWFQHYGDILPKLFYNDILPRLWSKHQEAICQKLLLRLLEEKQHTDSIELDRRAHEAIDKLLLRSADRDFVLQLLAGFAPYVNRSDLPTLNRLLAGKSAVGFQEPIAQLARLCIEAIEQAHERSVLLRPGAFTAESLLRPTTTSGEVDAFLLRASTEAEGENHEGEERRP
ncbi:MAG TPA: hypothetical protein VKV18_03700 [Chthonomonas sp.]|uniref:hypothetical protein n=1 Tax=Chthonomonas sp. TaxID=2282153 RepID=UPI002B4ADF68|nr:hypothetical protein [Chthonomonas sp.]HLI47781.1 hypothetical protein [Chthonomonas sp.]